MGNILEMFLLIFFMYFASTNASRKIGQLETDITELKYEMNAMKAAVENCTADREEDTRHIYEALTGIIKSEWFANKNKSDLLWHAVREGNVGLTDLMVRIVEDINEQDEDGKTFLFWTAWYGHTEIADLLLKGGAKVDKKDDNDQTPLHKTSRTDLARLLLDKGAEVNSQDYSGQTPLHKSKLPGIAEVLLNRGAEVNFQDYDGQTPLHIVARYGMVDAAEVLLNTGAQVNIQDNYGNTPLHISLQNKSVAVSKLLLNRGANVSIQNKQKKTPLDEAQNVSDSELKNMIKKLMKAQGN